MLTSYHRHHHLTLTVNVVANMRRFAFTSCGSIAFFHWPVIFLLSILLHKLEAGVHNEAEPFVIGTINGNARLLCNISVPENSALSVIWKHSDVEIVRCGISCSLTQKDEYTVGKISPSYLLIHSLQLHHAGRYSCLISTTSNTLQSSVTLHIEVPPTKLTIRDGETNATLRPGALVPVVEGKRRVLTCETGGVVTQGYDIFWNTTLKNQPDQIGSNMTVSAIPEGPRLFTKSTVLSFVPALEDNGKYITCSSVIDILTHESVSVAAILDVKVLPTRLSLMDLSSNETLHNGKNVRTQEGIPQTLICETNPPVKPSAELFWDTDLKERHILSRSNGTMTKNASGPLVISYITLTFVPQLLDDDAIIKCSTRHGEMVNNCVPVFVTLDVEVSPKYLVLRDPISRAIYRNEDILAVRAGMEKTLICETEPPVKPGVQLGWNTTVIDLILPHHLPTQIRASTNPQLVVSYATFTFQLTSKFHGKSISCETAQNAFGRPTVSIMVKFSIEGDTILDSQIFTILAIMLPNVLVLVICCGTIIWKKSQGQHALDNGMSAPTVPTSPESSGSDLTYADVDHRPPTRTFYDRNIPSVRLSSCSEWTTPTHSETSSDVSPHEYENDLVFRHINAADECVPMRPVHLTSTNTLMQQGEDDSTAKTRKEALDSVFSSNPTLAEGEDGYLIPS